MKGVGKSLRNGARVRRYWFAERVERMEDDKREARSGPQLPHKHTNGTEKGKSGKIASQAREHLRNTQGKIGEKN